VTQIRSMAPRPRRPGELGVHSVDHFNLTVPDLKLAQKFYSDFGLDVREEGNGLGLYTTGHDHRWGRIGEGPAKRLTYVSFGVYPEDLDGLRARLRQFDVAQLDAPDGFESNGIWFRDPDGTLIEMRVAEKSSPNEKAVQHNVSSPPGVQGSTARSKVPFVRPRRLAHILLFSRDISRSIDFYHRVLGLRLSDRSGDGVAFMHGIHGSDHHMIALAKSDGPGLHHLSWDVGSINEVGLGAMQMADRGFTAGWGLGRHVLGSNYFHYVRDPWGSYSEYSSDIDYIPVDMDWPAGDHPGHDAFYVWGPTPPEDFVVNHEIAV
jgi:catechol 2,3-dioxygenase-like lactoylglutathione lyase family enzyme